MMRIVFEHPALEEAVLTAIHKPSGDVLKEDVEALKTLVAENRGIESLKGLQCLSSLVELYLNRNRISDITPLAALTNLEVLELEDNQITDVNPVARLLNLRRLNVSRNRIEHVKPIAALRNLESLSFFGNQAKDVSSLRSLPLLQPLKFFPWESEVPIEEMREDFERADDLLARVLNHAPELENEWRRMGIAQQDQREDRIERIGEVLGTELDIGFLCYRHSVDATMLGKAYCYKLVEFCEALLASGISDFLKVALLQDLSILYYLTQRSPTNRFVCEGIIGDFLDRLQPFLQKLRATQDPELMVSWSCQDKGLLEPASAYMQRARAFVQKDALMLRTLEPVRRQDVVRWLEEHGCVPEGSR